MDTLKIPEKFTHRMKDLLGEEFDLFYKEITKDSSTRALFINTQKISLESFSQLFQNKLSPISFCDNGFYFDADGVGRSVLHHAGAFYVQDASAMSTVCAVKIEKGIKVLDMCASPGGKTLLAALKVGKDGLVVSNEYNVSRCKTLVGNIERFGLSNVICTNMDAAQNDFLYQSYREKFDLIIADCPCSGEGMFRKYPEQAIPDWSDQNTQKCAKRQSEILDNAALCLKNGGKLLYSTCTFSIQENEMVIDSFLSRHKDFCLIPVTKEVSDVTCDGYCFDGCTTQDIALTRRFYPHKSKGEGQFIALLQKCNDKANSAKKTKTEQKSFLKYASKEETSALEKFFKCLTQAPDYSRIYKYGENLIYCNNAEFIPEKHVFSCGVKIGEFSKNHITPHHSFFKCFGEFFKNKVEISDNLENIAKYLRGECIEANIDDGWCVITYHGIVLGGGKSVSGTIKNHYPKGLRNN